MNVFSKQSNICARRLKGSRSETMSGGFHDGGAAVDESVFYTKPVKTKTREYLDTS